MFFKINYALSTLPDLKQLVQTCILLVAPFTLHFTLLTFEFQIGSSMRMAYVVSEMNALATNIAFCHS